MSIEKEIRSRIKEKVALHFGGDDTRTMRDVAVDLINASGQDWKTIANGAYLCKATVAKLAKDQTRFPRYDTIERLFKYFEYQSTLKPVTISAKNANKPKGQR